MAVYKVPFKGYKVVEADTKEEALDLATQKDKIMFGIEYDKHGIVDFTARAFFEEVTGLLQETVSNVFSIYETARRISIIFDREDCCVSIRCNDGKVIAKVCDKYQKEDNNGKVQH